MSNPLIYKMPTQQAGQKQNTTDLNALYKQFSENPVKYLTGLDIPQGMNSPEQIVRFLAQNNKIPPMLQGRVNAMLGRR